MLSKAAALAGLKKGYLSMKYKQKKPVEVTRQALLNNL